MFEKLKVLKFLGKLLFVLILLGMDVLYEKDGVSYFYHNHTFLIENKSQQNIQ